MGGRVALVAVGSDDDAPGTEDDVFPIGNDLPVEDIPPLRSTNVNIPPLPLPEGGSEWADDDKKLPDEDPRRLDDIR